MKFAGVDWDMDVALVWLMLFSTVMSALSFIFAPSLMWLVITLLNGWMLRVNIKAVQRKHSPRK